jgi:hypothetical protein
VTPIPGRRVVFRTIHMTGNSGTFAADEPPELSFAARFG